LNTSPNRAYAAQALSSALPVVALSTRTKKTLPLAWVLKAPPQQNRNISLLLCAMVYQLNKDFPHLPICINSGIKTTAEVHEHLKQDGGVMISREAYHNPYWLGEWDREFYGDALVNAPSRKEIEAQMCDYIARRAAQFQTATHAISRHMLGLRHGQSGSRDWHRCGAIIGSKLSLRTR
jgi:tRNA-dihydrouridine synthase A